MLTAYNIDCYLQSPFQAFAFRLGLVAYRAKLYQETEGVMQSGASLDVYYGKQFFFHGDYIDSKLTDVKLNASLANLAKFIDWQNKITNSAVVINVDVDVEMHYDQTFAPA